MILITFALAVFAVIASVQCEHFEKSTNGKTSLDENVIQKLFEEVEKLNKANIQQDIKIGEYDRKLQEQDSLMRGLYIKIQEQDDTNRALNIRDQEQDAKIQEQDVRIHDQDAKIEEQNEIITNLQNECTLQQLEISPNTGSQMQPGTYVYPAFACDMETIIISCPNGRTINVTTGYYGQYLQTCSDTCCPPHPEDCKESIEENAPGDWYVLTTICNNQSSCEFQNPGRNVLSCADPYDSNYALVYYSCLPDDEKELSAFTASTDRSHDYNTGDVVIFDIIVTNVGNNYLTQTSTYVCPRAGLYVFSVTVYSYDGEFLTADLMCEDKQLATVNAFMTGLTDQATVTAVTECAPREQVWVKCITRSRVLDGPVYKPNIFTGVLLQPY